MSNKFDSFTDLPERLQVEALREGEMLLQAQLTIASAADQRGLTWGGLLLTGATAAIGAGVALLFKKGPNQDLISSLAACWWSFLFSMARDFHCEAKALLPPRQQSIQLAAE